jgi:hypothetical protein
MPKTLSKTPTADEIADMTSRGEDISSYFTNEFTVVRPVRRVECRPDSGDVAGSR